MKNLNIFSSVAEYENAKSGGVLDVPNVSFVDEDSSVRYLLENIDPYNGYEYVDLGLPSGLKWATCNVGASSPEQSGLYFAWGETEGYAGDDGHNFTWVNYKWSVDGSDKNFSKYNSTGATLDLEDDAAHVNLGGSWRMPTVTEIEELIANTTHTWTTNYEGTRNAGYIVKSKTNSNQIFMPAAGRCEQTELSVFGSEGFYFSSSQSMVNMRAGCYINFYSGNFKRNANLRCLGCSVRGVCE